MGQQHRQERHVVGLHGEGIPEWLGDEAFRSVQSAEELPFPAAEYETRLRRVRESMQAARLDALMVFRPSSVEYLCGFHTAETAAQPLLVTESQTFLYVPDLEIGRALASSCADRFIYSGYADALTGLAQFIGHAAEHMGLGARVGIEQGHHSTPPQAVRIWESHGAAVVDPDHLVETVRLVLSPEEIRRMEQAAAVTEEGLKAAVEAAGHPGATDAAVGGAVAEALYAGSDSMSAWGPLVVTGARSGIPHSSWDGSPLAAGPTFTEFSGTRGRYHAPVMRTLVRGAPEAVDHRLADLARTAVAAVLEHACPGVLCSEVALRASAALGPLPEDVMFHGLFGYPVGLAHKPHWMDGAPCHLAEGNHAPLQEGMAFHIPAAFRAFGKQGVGLSQTFVVEPNGARVITHGAADLIRVGE